MTIEQLARASPVQWGRQQQNGEVLLSAAWEVFILGVSVLSVFNYVFVLLLQPNSDVAQVVVIMDGFLTVVFLLDLLRRLSVAPDPRRYLVHGYGWLDALATMPVLRVFRVLRIVRVTRVMMRLGGPVLAFRAFFRNRAEGSLLSVLLVAILVLEFGALSMLAVERGAADANIETAEDAVWYVLVTMSTVGYGDQYPVTNVGRLIGSLIIVVGVGVFGTLTGYLANAFLSPSSAEAPLVAEDQPEAGGAAGADAGMVASGGRAEDAEDAEGSL